jgi:hypothetical protein
MVSKSVVLSAKVGSFFHPIPMNYWLVVYLHLWKIWKSVGTMKFRIYGKSYKIIFQTTNQIIISLATWPLGGPIPILTTIFWDTLCYGLGNPRIGRLFPCIYCHCWEHSINEHVIFKYKHIYVYIYMWQPKKRCRKIENSGIPSWKYCSIFLGFSYLHMSENKIHIKSNHRHIFNHQHVISLKPMMFSPCWKTCSFSMGNYIAVIFNALIC